MACCASPKSRHLPLQRLTIAETAAISPQINDGAPPGLQTLQAELQQMKRSELCRRIRVAGISEEEIDLADDSSDPRGALIDLLVAFAAPSGLRTRSYPDLGSRRDGGRLVKRSAASPCRVNTAQYSAT